MGTAIGSIIGTYVITEPLAESAYSTISKAVSLDDGAERLIEISHEDAPDKTQSGFRRNAEALSAVRNRHLLTVIETGETGSPAHAASYAVYDDPHAETLSEYESRKGDDLGQKRGVNRCIRFKRALCRRDGRDFSWEHL